MKKNITKNITKGIYLLAIIATILISSSLSAQQNDVSFIINDGLHNESLKDLAEKNISKLLSEINAAQSEKRGLNLANIRISQQASESIAMLWENIPFRCVDELVVERCLQYSTGYQIRNIPLMLKPTETTTQEDEFQEAVISFNSSGQITTFYLTLAMNLYSNIMKDGLEIKDLRRRQLILDYVEQFRTAYNMKDIKFLNQIFSEDALIITGNVVQSRTFEGQYQPKVTYKKQSKQQYLTNLKNIFNRKKYIKVVFDNIKVMNVKGGSKSHYYGVLLHQGWTADNYSDTGYVFLLWDFENEDAPQIHVRTWQPDYLDQARTQKLPEEEIFNLTDFDL